MALGSDGNLWFTSVEINDSIGRITPAGAVRIFPVDEADDIVGGPDGNLWFTGTFGGVGRITPAGVVTTFTSPAISSISIGLAAGPDGNVWFTTSDNHIARITPSGVISTFTSSAVQDPQTIAAGPDGNLWFTNRQASTIGRITPTGTITSFALPEFNNPADNIVEGPDGTMWFSIDSDNVLGRITTSGTVSIVTAIPQASAVGGMTTGPDGNVWYTDAGLETINRVTPAGDSTEFQSAIARPVRAVTDDTGNVWIANNVGGVVRRSPDGELTSYPDPTLRIPSAITIGPDDNIWIALQHEIVRMTRSGVTTRFDVPGSTFLDGITTGPDDNLWFTDQDGIGRLTTDGDLTMFPVGDDSSPALITTGPDGNLWFTDSNDAIGRMTPTGEVSRYTSPIVSRPAQITAGPDGNLWFTNTGGTHIGRITTDGVITGFPAPLSTAGIAVGSDGNLWYTTIASPMSSDEFIGVMTTAGQTIRFTGFGIDEPLAITSGPDGDLLFTNLGNSSLGRITALGSPPPPTAAAAIAGASAATVHWTAPITDGGSPVTGYAVTPYVGYFPLPTQTFNSTETTQTITGLDPTKTYRFRVQATNTNGSGSYSKVSNPVTPLGSPGAPSIGTATAGNRQATISWTTPTQDGGSPITGYIVTPYVGYIEHPSTTFESAATTQTVTELVNGKTYRFRVRAINAIGTGPYSKVTNPVTPST
jgi:streptogramin lyase